MKSSFSHFITIYSSDAHLLAPVSSVLSPLPFFVIVVVIIIIIIIIIIHQCFLPGGRSFIANSGTKAAALLAGLPLQTQEPRLQFY